MQDYLLLDALHGATILVTFNCGSFDLPAIARQTGLDFKRHFGHCDLMYVCRARGLRGGLKAIEAQLGITRGSDGVYGRDAPRLWRRYTHYAVRVSLHKMLDYNRDD